MEFVDSSFMCCNRNIYFVKQVFCIVYMSSLKTLQLSAVLKGCFVCSRVCNLSDGLSLVTI